LPARNKANRAASEVSCSSRRSEKAFFAYGFAKSERDNIRRDELKAFRKLADEMLTYDDKALAAAMKNGTIVEIRCHG
jgi:hypothetical protein